MGEPCGRQCPLIPWLLALLLVTAGTTAVQIEPVSGVLGGSVLLPLNLSTSSVVKRISWKFTANGSIKKEVVEFNLQLSPQPKYSRERLKLFNKTVLQITALELSDSGVYEAQVTYQSTEVYERSFNLSVYEPVPEPQIQHELLSFSTQDCSITLRCSVPARSSVQTTWQHSSTSSTIWRQSEDGHTLYLTVPASTLNATYTCVAWNPVQEKSKSVYLAALCTHEVHRWRWPIYLAVLTAVLGALSITLYLLRRKKRANSAAASPEEPVYAQVQRGDVEEGDEQGLGKTIYSEVMAGGDGTAGPQA
ncbi:T-lymphocyte surface antigen Ly-9-like isoform X2 [Cyrtonyx montezumae]|uniref:T-lymphocyte surface antigen Ly-9-like isoform X2 n=1 Tax=Cyrtonyx montezumae TaxID=9017 RepID=UPI0032D9FD3B